MNSLILFFRFVFLFLLIAALSTGCGVRDTFSESDTMNPQKNMESLTFRITWKSYSGRGEAIARIADTYNAKNQTAYKVAVIDGNEDLAAIEGLLEKGGTADIYMLPYRYVQYLGYMGKLEDITDSFRSEKNLFYERLWQLGVVDHKVYGVPWLGHSMGLIYNKQLLKKAGVDPAGIQSLDELIFA